MTKFKFAIIGNPISHSLSPVLHNYWFKKYKIDAEYSLMEIKESQIVDVIKKLKEKELKGINVTVPYKQEVIQHVDLIINDAKKTSSINTIYLNDENKIVGENTDVYGFEQAFLNKITTNNLREKFFLILGAGGVTSSIIYALEKRKIKKVFISNRTLQKAENIKISHKGFNFQQLEIKLRTKFKFKSKILSPFKFLPWFLNSTIFFVLE